MDVPPHRPAGANPPNNCPWPRFEKPQPLWYKPPLRLCEPIGFAVLVRHACKLGDTAPRPWIEPPWAGDVPMPAFPSASSQSFTWRPCPQQAYANLFTQIEHMLDGGAMFIVAYTCVYFHLSVLNNIMEQCLFFAYTCVYFHWLVWIILCTCTHMVCCLHDCVYRFVSWLCVCVQMHKHMLGGGAMFIVAYTCVHFHLSVLDNIMEQCLFWATPVFTSIC